MKELWLTPTQLPSIPVEAEVISPDVVSGKTLKEIEGLKVYVGNSAHRLGEFFEVEGEVAEAAADQMIVVDGSVQTIKYIGAKMTAGSILVKGCAGMHTGSQMSGGELVVEENTRDWAGAEMKGGLLRIGRDSRNLTGAAYRGSSEGMTGGCIVVDGDAGVEVGSFMRRGMIIVRGGVGPFAGVHMNGGEIFVFGRAARRLGAEAKGNGGFIACLGEVESILPTYLYDTTYTPAFMKLYLRQMRDDLGIEEATNFIDAPFRRYRGDLAVGGNAEILIAENR
ncbi:MAG: formylmethanofuran dehydrogenase subunit C [Candidatus Bathyarchaeota archaeon]|nr:formylmethanofuran dehydrogenase subunit C [Candidatus Bathyarchaeota archaeon]